MKQVTSKKPAKKAGSVFNPEEKLTLGEFSKLSKSDISKLPDHKKEQVENLGKALQNLSSGIEIALPTDPLSNFKLPAVVPKPSLAEQRKQTEILRQIAEQSKEKDADMHIAIQPRLDTKNHTLFFANMPVKLNPDSEQYKICRKLFRGEKPVTKPVEIGDLFEVLDVEGKSVAQKKKKVYNLLASLNKQIAIDTKTGITDLFIVDKKVWFNKKYM